LEALLSCTLQLIVATYALLQELSGAGHALRLNSMVLNRHSIIVDSGGE